MIDFKGSHFEKEIILWGIRWYVAYPISYRQLEEMMGERGVAVDHSTLDRWVIKYAPEVEKQFRRLQRPVGRSWRMDETYVRVKGEWKCLYRAVDQEGQTISYGMSSWNTQTGSSQSSGQSSSHSHYNSVGGSHTHASTRGGSTMHAKTRGGSVARATSLSLGERYSETESETQGMSRGQSWEHGQARSHSESATESKTVTRGRTPSISEEES